MNGTLLHPIITRLLNDYIPAKQRPPLPVILWAFICEMMPRNLSIKLVW